MDYSEKRLEDTHMSQNISKQPFLVGSCNTLPIRRDLTFSIVSPCCLPQCRQFSCGDEAGNGLA